MANREALRELQARLAQRLQEARSNESRRTRWLAVQVGPHNYLLPLEQAGEIFSWTQVLPVPYTTSWFWGVANLRGSLAGVVDLGAFLGHPVQRSEQSLREVSLLLVNTALQVNVALVVDRLQGLRGEEDFVAVSQAGDAAAGQADAAWAGKHYADAQGQHWQVLHLHALVQSPQFLNIRL